MRTCLGVTLIFLAGMFIFPALYLLLGSLILNREAVGPLVLLAFVGLIAALMVWGGIRLIRRRRED